MLRIKNVVRQCLKATGLHKQQFLKFLQKSDLKWFEYEHVSNEIQDFALGSAGKMDIRK